MRPKLQKQSALKLAGRIIPQSGGFNTTQRSFESVSKACGGVHTRDFTESYRFKKLHYIIFIVLETDI
jgi:hypothetical protein